MPPRPRSHGSDGEEPSQPPRSRPIAHSVRAGEADAADLIRSGRPGNSQLITTRGGEPNGVPTGRSTYIRPKADEETRRSIERENEGAMSLAASGYRVHQNPSLAEVAQARQAAGDFGRPTSEPDYLVEGRVFDCSAPAAGTDAHGVWSGVRKKIRKEQTQRVVIHLGDWDGNLAELRQQFLDWPIANCKEVKAILPDGSVVQIDLPRVSD